MPIEEGVGNIAQPEGRALLWLKDFLPRRTKIPKGKCGDTPYTEELDSVKTIYVEPDGRIAVCKEFYIGNASEADIIDIIENYDPFKIPEAKAIIETGVEGLINWAKEKGVKPNPNGYYNICHYGNKILCSHFICGRIFERIWWGRILVLATYRLVAKSLGKCNSVNSSGLLA